MVSESSLYARFRAQFAGRFNRIERVENPIAPGMPDVNCCLLGVGEFWLEVKAPTEPKRPSTPLFGSNHRVSQSQISWHRHQHQAGGKSYFIIDTDVRLILVCGSLAEEINEMTVDELVKCSLFCAMKPMRKELWTQFKDALLR